MIINDIKLKPNEMIQVSDEIIMRKYQFNAHTKIIIIMTIVVAISDDVRSVIDNLNHRNLHGITAV